MTVFQVGVVLLLFSLLIGVGYLVAALGNVVVAVRACSDQLKEITEKLAEIRIGTLPESHYAHLRTKLLEGILAVLQSRKQSDI